jgi:undecaprenyl-diphosphatase
MLDILAIFFAKYVVYLLLVLAILFILKQQKTVKKELIILSIVSLPIIFVVAKILSHFYIDPRPFVVGHFKPLIPHDATNGFPSDHGLISFAVASIVYLYNKKTGLLLFVLGILIGIARVYAGIHHLIDILGSFVICILVVGLIHLVVKKRLHISHGEK